MCAVLPHFLHCIYLCRIFINGCLLDTQVTGEERKQTDIYIYIKTLSCVFLSGSETEMESKRDKASESNPDQHKISSNELWDLYLKVKLSSVCSHDCVFSERKYILHNTMLL